MSSSPIAAYDAARPFVAFDSTASFAGPTEAVVTGTASDNSGPVFVEVYDGSKDLGAATVDAGGAWSFDAHLSPGTHDLGAVATDLAGKTATADSPYTLVTGITDRPYVYREIDHGSDGQIVGSQDFAADGSQVSVTVSNGNGTHAITGNVGGQLLHSVANDTMTAGGGDTRFVFSPHFGRDEITNFTARGPDHDILSLPASTFANLAAVLHHTTSALDGSAVIHVDPNDSIKVDGVTKAQLLTHPQDFRLHG